MRYVQLLLCVGAFAPFLSFAQTQEIVSGSITQNTTWTNDKIYLLTGYVYVKNEATLTIEPGTTIQGDKDSKGTLIITRGAKIIADGTRSQPIVFTSNAANPAPGDWGGVVVLGYAPTNSTANGLTCLGVAEGGINTPSNDARFGSGDQPGGCGHVNDNSGILRFVRIEYGGIVFQMNNETNGLTLAGVGNGTTIDYVEVAHSDDDGFEFFGGTVNAKHLVSYSNKDDDFDFDLGYQGNVQFLLAVRNPAISDISGSNGIEVDNDNAGTPASPRTRPALSNATIVGPTGSNMDDNFRRAAYLRRNSEPALYNSLFIGQYPVGLCIDGVGTVANAQNNLLEVKNTYFADAVELLKTSDVNFNIAQWFDNSDWHNEALNSSLPLALQAPFNTPDPEPQPMSNSLVNTGAAFTASRANIPFFDKIAYVGAFNSIDDWTCGWAKFEDLNTNCVVGTTPAAPMQDLALLPNVATQQTVLVGNMQEGGAISVSVLAMNGQEVSQMQSFCPAGPFQIPVTIGHLQPGIYFVQLKAHQQQTTLKLVVVPSR